MNKLLILAVGSLLLNTTLFAQDSSLVLKLKHEPKWTATLHSGYAVALGSTFQFYPDNITNIAVSMPANGTPSKDVTYRAQTRGLGEGFRFGGGLSYVLNDFLNVGVDLDYFQSSISRTRDSSMQQTTVMTGGGIATNSFRQANTISYSARLLTIAPNITFKAISRPKFFIYNKIGAILVLHPNAIQHDKETDAYSQEWQGYVKDSSATSGSRYDWGIKGPAWGFMGAIGAQVKLTERIRAFTELQFTHVLYVIKNRVTTNYDVDGKEMVNTLPLSERQIDFQKVVNNNLYGSDPNAPTVTVTQRFPLTYVGLQFGLAYRF